MHKNILETLMGAIVLIVAGVFLAFAYNGSQMRVEEGYTISGKFNNASGISLGSGRAHRRHQGGRRLGPRARSQNL